MAGAGVLLGWAGWVVYKAFSGDVELADQWSGTGAFALAVLLALPQLRSSPQPARVDQSDRAANDLAQAVWKRSREEERRQKVHDPVPLPVRWHNAPGDLVDQWENIHGVPAGVRSEPLCLDNTVDDIAETFRSIPSQRLVVLGKAGSGKTVLAHHLIHQLLDQRESTDPVPVLFSLNTWDVTTPLRDWLVAQLRRDYDLDGTDSTGTTLAQALVDNDRILPVLDGFDEITAERRATEENHRTALSTLNDTDLPIVLTSRPDEYRNAVTGDHFLAKAAAIELEDLTLDELASYLTRTTRKNPNGNGDTPWDPVLRHLREQPHDPASAQLRQVLSTPLMVFLARTIYSAPARRDPAELLNTTVFRSTEHVENHLLDAFIPAIYTNNTDRSTQRPHPRWRADQAQRWLGYLADHLTKRNTHDLTWWHLPTTLSRRTRHRAAGLALGLVLALPYGLSFGIAAGHIFDVTTAIGVGLVAAGVAPGTGLLVGLTRGHLPQPKAFRKRRIREPERLRLKLPRREWATTLKRTAFAFSRAFAVGFVFGFAGNLLIVFAGPSIPMRNELTSGLMWGFVLGIPVVVIRMASYFGDTHDPHAATPWTLLTQDRTAVLIRTTTMIALVALLTTGGLELLGMTDGIAHGDKDATDSTGFIVTGVMLGGLTGGVILNTSAWGNWMIIARLWLPLTRRLPWRPKRFLEDAHRRGVLRTTGAVYQFRHAQLRDHLAAQYRNQPDTTPPQAASERDGLNPAPEPR